MFFNRKSCNSKNALIGAGSIVTKDVEENSTTVGNPSRKTGGKKTRFYK